MNFDGVEGGGETRGQLGMHGVARLRMGELEIECRRGRQSGRATLLAYLLARSAEFSGKIFQLRESIRIGRTVSA